MGDYAGIGPGAHGRLTLAGGRVATNTLRSPEAWLDAVRTNGSGEVARENLSPRDQALEYLMMSLRLTEGCDTDRVTGLAPDLLSADGITSLSDQGFVTLRDGILQATPAGRMVLNRLFVDLTR